MKRYVWGAILIALGIMGFLQSSGQFNFGLSVWPVLLTLAGGAMVWGSLQKRWGPSWISLGLGLWLGCIGLFQILHTAGITPVTGAAVARLGWPLILVGIGISIAAGRWHCSDWGRWHEGCEGMERPGRRHHRHHYHGHGAHWGYLDRCSLGDRYHGRDRWTLDGDLDLSHGAGDFVLDLATAEITDGVHQIRVSAGLGELLIRVPDNVNATIDAAVSIGQLEVLDEERSGIGDLTLQKRIVAPESPVELRIEARLRIGELVVMKVPGYPRVAS